MYERESRENYFLTLVKFLLFLVILCFLAAVSKEFWSEIRFGEGLNLSVLVFSIIAAFGFYEFIADLGPLYKRLQHFFFRSSFAGLILPSLLLLLMFGYFFLPRIFNASFNKDVFVFLGGFSLTMHLIFVARQTQGRSLATAVNYLFVFSGLCLINLILFMAYLKIGYDISIGSVLIQGAEKGVDLIQSSSNIF